MNGDANAIFVDTKAAAPFHAIALRRLQDHRLRQTSLWISRQVLREYLSVVTRPQTFAAPLLSSTAVQRVRFFESRFYVADETASVTAQLALLLETLPIGGKQIHDANIVATMLVHGIGRLLTHNVADFVRFAHLISVLPLVAADEYSPDEGSGNQCLMFMQGGHLHNPSVAIR